MFKKLGDTFFNLSLADGSRDQYSSGVKMWVAFAKLFKFDIFTDLPYPYEWFALWRFRGTKCKSQTIRGNFAHINNFRASKYKRRLNWTQICPRLTDYYRIFDRLRPKEYKSIPINEELISKFKKFINFNNWTLFTWWTANILAYSFAMRSCEYSETKHYNSPLLNAISIAKSTKNEDLIIFKIIKSKNNQTGLAGKPEILKASCCCPSLCIFCTMLFYLKKRMEIHDKIPDKYQKYLFLTEKSVRIKLDKNSKNKKYKFKLNNGTRVKELVPLKSSTMLLILRDLLKNITTEGFKYNLHGYRFGGITDLAALGFSEAVLKGISRHSPNSLVLYRYIRFTPEQIAQKIKAKKQIVKI